LTPRTAPVPGQVIDVGTLLDSGSWTAYQKALTLLAALAVIFDGFDIQILGFAIPSIMREWHVVRAAFAPVAALGLAGMIAGSAAAGYCGDRFGRRAALIGCVLLFGAATIATAFCSNVTELAILRTLAGAGVGGALPNASALTAEFAPLSRRAAAVTLTIVCVPLGGLIAGLTATRVLPSLGWHVLYMIGGAAPLLLAVLLLAALPESPRFLARHVNRRPELVRLLAKMGHRVAPDQVFDNVQEQKLEGSGAIRSLLSQPFLRDTSGLWLAFFSSLIGVYLVFSWLPAMLTAQGLDLATASSSLAAYNFGGVLGVLLCTLLVTAMGSRWPMLFAALGGAASALALRFVPIQTAGGHMLLIAGFGLHGLFVNALQTTMYAVASHVYPTKIRATGIAYAAAAGRVGGTISSLAGAAVIQSGSGTFLGVLTIAMFFAGLGVALIRNHYRGGLGGFTTAQEATPVRSEGLRNNLPSSVA
jgi:MFS transporter, AAHS family, 4-hydroxybenzoate transporter